MSKLITRKQYLAGEFTHKEYYGQFLELCRGTLLASIPLSTLKHSTCVHLNDIALKRWDRLYVDAALGRALTAANESIGYSLSDKVCAYKTAAAIIREE